MRLYVYMYKRCRFFSHSSSANISAINNLLLLCLIHLDSRKHVIEYNMAYAKLVVSNGAYLIYKQLNHWKCDREKNMQTEQKSNELEWMEKSRVFFFLLCRRREGRTVCKQERNTKIGREWEICWRLGYLLQKQERRPLIWNVWRRITSNILGINLSHFTQTDNIYI